MAELTDKVHWIEIKIRTNGEIAEALAEVLGRFVSQGIVMESIMQFDPQTHDQVPTGEIIVSGYLPVDEHLEDNRQKLEEALWHLGQIADIPEPEYTPVMDQDWMAAWKQHYTPIPIGESLLILPAWIEPDPNDTRTAIRINPAMAFGTGSHPTTSLILSLLERHFEPGKAVIDIGCGSGILSIAALKKGAIHALAVDIDSQAVQSTLENAGINTIPPGMLETGKGSVEEILTERFSLVQAPLVLANILAPVILHLFEQGLADLVSPKGILLLSGILDHQVDAVLASAQTLGFNLLETLAEEDWVAIALQKRH